MSRTHLSMRSRFADYSAPSYRQMKPTHRSPLSRQSRAGLTILEVMLAMFVLVLVFGAALSAVVHVSSVVAAAKTRTRAVAVLNQKLEEMRALTFTNLNAKLSSASFTSGAETDAAFTGTGVRSFQWTRTVDGGAADVSGSMVKVVVTVSWVQAGHAASISAYSYFAKYGILTAESAAT